MPLNEFLDIAGINVVYWIDDGFKHQSSDYLKTQVRAQIAMLRAVGITPEHELLSPNPTVFSDADIELDLEAEDNHRIDRLSSQELQNLIDAFEAKLRGEGVALPTDALDFTDAELARLSRALGDRVQLFTPSEWSRAKSQILPTCCNRNTLFLIDQKFGNDNGPYRSGNEVLGEVLQATHSQPVCIMFSKEAVPGQEESFRDGVFKDLVTSLPKCRKSWFAVMSKQTVGRMGTSEEGDISMRFTTALRVVTAHRLCYRLGRDAAVAMSSKLASAVDELDLLPMSDIDRVIFANPFNDGSSEVEVIIRILNLHSRVAVQQRLINGGEAWFHDLRAVRRLIKDTPPFDLTPVSEPLHQLRQLEVIDPPEYVNKIHSPLQCGDFFEVQPRDQSSPRLFVLLAPPCDLAVRHRGDRHVKMGTLVEIVKERQKRKSLNPDVVNLPEHQFDDGGRYYEVKGVVLTGGFPLLIDARRMFHVKLDLLDYVVFHGNGEAQLSQATAPPAALLPGYTNRFSIALGKLKPSDAPICLDSALGVSSKWDRETHTRTYNIRRIGHIRSQYSQALFTAYVSYQARAAFEHDFTRDDDLQPASLTPANDTQDASAPLTNPLDYIHPELPPLS